MGMYDAARDFIARRTRDEEQLTEQYLKHANDARNPMGFGSIFSNKNNVYREIPQMLQDPIIASCVAVVMETAFQPTADDGVVRVTSPYKIIVDELEAFHREYEIDSAILTTGFNTLVYGNVPIRIEYDTALKFKRYRFMPNFTEVIPVIVSNRTLGYLYNGKFHDPFEFVYAQHLYYKDLGGTAKKTTSQHADGGLEGGNGALENEFILAPSYLSPGVRPWRNIKIIEDALLLQRLDVSNYMRIIGVKVGDKVFSKQAVRLLNFYRQLFKKVRRVSYDGDGMSSSSFGNDFEVIVPYTDSQTLDVKDIGGQVDVRALRDLEIQYKRLFSSLRMMPSYIGFSEDGEANSLGGDATTNRRDERFARLVKALRMSTTQTIKKLDVNYLRSKGYDVTESDFNFVYLAASTVEDEERRNTFQSYVTSIASTVEALTSTGMPFNKNYLVKELFSQAFASTSVDVERLFNTEDMPKEKMPVQSSLLAGDRAKVYSEYVRLGVMTAEEVGRVRDSRTQITSSQVKVMEQLPILSYQRYLGLGDVLSSGRDVDISSIVASVSRDMFNPGSSLKSGRDAVLAPCAKVYSDLSVVSAENLASGTISPIENLYFYEDGYYLTGQDLYNYLYMLDQSVRGIPVKQTWKQREN